MKNPFEKFRVWEDKYALTFVGCVLAVLFGIPALYPLFEKKDPKLTIEAISRANVIDVKEQVSDLDVIYKGASLRSNNQTLAVVTLKISNDGAAPIPINAYDQSAPVGVMIAAKSVPAETTKNAIVGEGHQLPFSLSVDPVVTKAEVISASRPYLYRNVNLTHTGTNAVFSPVIFQVGDWFEIKLLILHGEGKDFDITPIGEIAGVKQVEFVGLNVRDAPPSFWKRVFGGTFGVQLFRIGTYFSASVAASILLSLFLSAYARAKAKAVIINAKNNRKQKIVTFKTHQLETRMDATEFEWLLYYYIEHGERPLQVLNAALDNLSNMRKSVFISTLPTGLFGILFDRKLVTLDLANGQFVIKKEFSDFLKVFGKFVNPIFEQESNLIHIKRRENKSEFEKLEGVANLASQMKEGFGKSDKAVN